MSQKQRKNLVRVGLLQKPHVYVSAGLRSVDFCQRIARVVYESNYGLVSETVPLA